jgi:DNA-binding MarR family transcriptional regulator
MADLERLLADRNASQEFKQRNAERFMWHQRLIRNGRSLKPTAVLLAGLIMHKRRLTIDGYVALSAKDIADELGITDRGAQKARDQLVAEGWLEQVPFRGQKKAHYRITFPPSTVH